MTVFTKQEIETFRTHVKAGDTSYVLRIQGKLYDIYDSEAVLNDLTRTTRIEFDVAMSEEDMQKVRDQIVHSRSWHDAIGELFRERFDVEVDVKRFKQQILT